MIKKQLMPMNLQFFAEPGDPPANPPAGPSNPTDPPANPPTPPTPPTPPAFTMEDVLKQFKVEDIFANETVAKALQSQRDSAVTNALKTARAKWDQEKLDDLDEATKMAKMTAAEREAYQFKKDKEAFEAQKKAFAHEQLKTSTGAELLKRGLDASFAEYLTADTEENTKLRIDAFETAFNAAVSVALNNKMRGTNPPKDPKPADKNATLDEQIYKFMKG